jgi:hypothetical protein
LRGITPLASYPAEIKDWELKFMGEGGMGTVWEKPGASLHGVLHVVTEPQMRELDKMEGGYDHVDVVCHLYDGTTKPAVAYKFKTDRVKEMKTNNPPSERYLDIIIRGCEHYGVKQSWVDFLKAHPFVPRKKPSEYKKLPEPEDKTKFVTKAELSKYDGRDGRELMVAVNGKVCKWAADPTNPAAGFTFKWLAENVGGKDATIFWARGLYEPKYPIAKSFEEMTPEHRAFVEDLATMRMLSNFKVIGYLKD